MPGVEPEREDVRQLADQSPIPIAVGMELPLELPGSNNVAMLRFRILILRFNR